MHDLAKTLVSSLDRSPLAIKQASADLCSQGPLSVKSLTRYMRHLEIEYTKLMEHEMTTEDCFYDKDDKSIIGTFNLLERAIKHRDSNALNLLRLCSVIGPGRIPMSFCLQRLPTTEDQDIATPIPSNSQSSQESSTGWRSLMKRKLLKA